MAEKMLAVKKEERAPGATVTETDIPKMKPDEVLVKVKGFLCLGKARTISLKFFHDPINLGIAQFRHHIKGPFPESQCDLAAEVEVFPCSDPPVNNIKGLGKEDPQHPVPDGIFNVLLDIDFAARPMCQPPVNRP